MLSHRMFRNHAGLDLIGDHGTLRLLHASWNREALFDAVVTRTPNATHARASPNGDNAIGSGPTVPAGPSRRSDLRHLEVGLLPTVAPLANARNPVDRRWQLSEIERVAAAEVSDISLQGRGGVVRTVMRDQRR